MKAAAIGGLTPSPTLREGRVEHGRLAVAHRFASLSGSVRFGYVPGYAAQLPCRTVRYCVTPTDRLRSQDQPRPGHLEHDARLLVRPRLVLRDVVHLPQSGTHEPKAIPYSDISVNRIISNFKLL